MGRAWWVIVPAAAGILLAAAARAESPAGFGDYAGRGYAEIAAYARNRAGNPALAAWFEQRARAAAAGEAIAPAEPARWRLPAATAREAAAARGRLMALLRAGARQRAPYRAAVAQVNFDCWMPQFRARQRGLPGSADCRRRFYVSLAALQREMRGPGTEVARAESGTAPPVIRVSPTPPARRDTRNVIEEGLAAGFGSCPPGHPGDPCRSARASSDRLLADCAAEGCGGDALDPPVSALAAAAGAGAVAPAAGTPAAAVASAPPGAADPAPAAAGDAGGPAARKNGNAPADGKSKGPADGGPNGDGGPKGNGGPKGEGGPKGDGGPKGGDGPKGNGGPKGGDGPAGGKD